VPLNEVAYRVEDVQTANALVSGGVREKAKEGIFVLVELQITNESDTDVRLDINHFELMSRGEDGRGPAAVRDAVLQKELSFGELAGKAQNSGLLVFDLPEDKLVGLRLVIHSARGPDQEAVIDLELPNGRPPLEEKPKAFHGTAKNNAEVELKLGPKGLGDVVLDPQRRGREPCHLDLIGSKPRLQSNGSFRLESAEGVVLIGQMTSSLEVSGTLEQRRPKGESPCLPRGDQAKFSMRAAP
jgi:hypothetical protein